MQSVRAAVFAAACLLALPVGSLAQTDSPAKRGLLSVLPPAWAYPVNPSNMPNARDEDVAVRVPHSECAFLPSQLQDLFNAPDWHPKDHPTMPDVVARGRKPGVYACEYCHLPDGAGRPENASLAGLPVGYIMQQLADFKSGARRTAVPVRVPPQLRHQVTGCRSFGRVKRCDRSSSVRFGIGDMPIPSLLCTQFVRRQR
jgi:hypothetical protein